MLLAPNEIVSSDTATYKVEGIVGTGAYGAVYSARDPMKPGRHVALKEFFAATHPREQKSLEQLFEREAYVGVQASPHPLMPTFYEAFIADNRFYLAQEFIVGETLDAIILRRHPLPREWVLKWSASLCDALAFLHERKIVHHDLKPPNIRITPQGHLSLLDFGAAQHFTTDEPAKKPADLYGTEGYLPPEIESNGQWVADARTDIFALGCIIYEMISGESPDQGQINDRSMYVTNSLMQRPNADLNLVKLINKALSYNTEFRYSSAGEFLRDIRHIAPPVLLVDKKHLRFGNVESGEFVEPQKVSLYNAGGGVMRGEIKPRSPWISSSTKAFNENFKTVEVTINRDKIEEKGGTVTGRLEINSSDDLAEDGSVRSSGDRWFIECSIAIACQPAKLTVVGGDFADDGAIRVAPANDSTEGTVVTIKNSGESEVTAEISITSSDQAASTKFEVSPASAIFKPGETVSCTITLKNTDNQEAMPDSGVLNITNSGSVLYSQAVRIRTTQKPIIGSLTDKLRGLFSKK